MSVLGVGRGIFKGKTMGGATALGLAQQNTQRLDKVIVCDSPRQSTPTIFFFQAEDGIRDADVTGVQTCALPISRGEPSAQEREQAPRGSSHARARQPEGPPS